MKTGQLVAQATTTDATPDTAAPQSVAPADTVTKPAPESTTLSTGEAPASKTNTTVARVHEAKDIPSKTLWTAHTIGGALFLFAVLCIVFARGPTRKQALAAQLNETK